MILSTHISMDGLLASSANKLIHHESGLSVGVAFHGGFFCV